MYVRNGRRRIGTDGASAGYNRSRFNGANRTSVCVAALQRFVAHLLDLIPIGVLTCFLFLLTGWANSPLFTLSMMVYMVFSHFITGTTMGKYIVGIEVVQEHGSRMPRICAMLLRDTVGRIVSSVLFGMGYWFPTNRKNKAWSDSIAGTIAQERETLPSVRICLWIILLAMILLEIRLVLLGQNRIAG